ncbi:MAG: acyl-CoA dehydrogenase family protein [Acidimicrobiales bacterium]
MKLYQPTSISPRSSIRTSTLLRQSIAELYTLLQVNRLNVQRARSQAAHRGRGQYQPLFDSELHRRFRDVSLDIVGADGMLDEKSTATDSSIAEIVLFASAPSIYGGTDQIQKNIIGERALGLPKEPGPASDTPYKDLPKISSRCPGRVGAAANAFRQPDSRHRSFAQRGRIEDQAL